MNMASDFDLPQCSYSNFLYPEKISQGQTSPLCFSRFSHAHSMVIWRRKFRCWKSTSGWEFPEVILREQGNHCWIAWLWRPWPDKNFGSSEILLRLVVQIYQKVNIWTKKNIMVGALLWKILNLTKSEKYLNKHKHDGGLPIYPFFGRREPGLPRSLDPESSPGNLTWHEPWLKVGLMYRCQLAEFISINRINNLCIFKYGWVISPYIYTIAEFMDVRWI